MSTPTYYQILGVSCEASTREIKLAYRRLVKQFHPDSQSVDADRETTVQLNAAYEVLSDPQRRLHYDRELTAAASPQRQRRTVRNQHRYQAARQQDTNSDRHFDRWLATVYAPVNQLIDRVVTPLATQIDALAADPFDDELMAAFQHYLSTCRTALSQAQQRFASQPNPARLASAATNLYYCLNHLGDGLDEFDWFVLNYDDSYLHTGCEFFHRAARLQSLAHRELQGWLADGSPSIH
ncbi:MAG: J domain-containing protein [Spirulinaceae cyanobacterium RM2_2_10]|nr:J domain-containing protein [Spirulinaceae cyanobacterium SM2_1_0]NJO19375.1 J domain-containing protein [Spirulinaceae cyanobacterium RM2_2_10]